MSEVKKNESWKL